MNVLFPPLLSTLDPTAWPLSVEVSGSRDPVAVLVPDHMQASWTKAKEDWVLSEYSDLCPLLLSFRNCAFRLGMISLEGVVGCVLRWGSYVTQTGLEFLIPLCPLL